MSDRRRPEAEFSGRPLVWGAAGLVILGVVALFVLWPSSRPSHPRVAASAASEPEEAVLEAPAPSEPPRPAPAAAPVARPARRAEPSPEPVNLFATRGPEIIDIAHDIVFEGGTVSLTKLKEVYDYGKAHPGDARPQLIMAADAMARGWYDQAVDHYVSAAKEDPRARFEPRALPDLVKMAGKDHTAKAAAEALEQLYGRGAADAVQAGITEASADEDEARGARLSELLRRLQAAPDRTEK